MRPNDCATTAMILLTPGLRTARAATVPRFVVDLDKQRTKVEGERDFRVVRVSIRCLVIELGKQRGLTSSVAPSY